MAIQQKKLTLTIPIDFISLFVVFYSTHTWPITPHYNQLDELYLMRCMDSSKSTK